MAQRGDPHFERSSQIIFKSGGHIKQGAGLWLKKKSQIAGYSTTVAPNGRNMNGSDPGLDIPVSKKGRPTGDINNYFFLPAYGGYVNGRLRGQVSDGLYYSNKRTRGQTVVGINFDENIIHLRGLEDGYGVPLWTVQ